MKNYRGEIITTLFISLVIIGAIAFFYSNLNKKQTEEQIDIYDLILPEAEYVLSINKPFLFSTVLERQPQLNTYFKSLIPEDYFSLLTHVKHSSVLLAYYPQGVVMYYQLHNESDELSACFEDEISVAFKKDKVRFDFYPKAENRYLGKYLYEGVCVVSGNRKLLETVAEYHQSERTVCPSLLKKLRKKMDNGALLNALFQPDPISGWQTVDLFLHEEQVCCLYNQSFTKSVDTLLMATADSLVVLIEQIIPGIEVQSGLSRGDSVVYYTFCTPLPSASISFSN